MDHADNCPVTGKRKYLSEREALETAAHQISTNNAPQNLKAYECQWCDSWHLTKGAATPAAKRAPQKRSPKNR
jgi:hypothetical protein